MAVDFGVNYLAVIVAAIAAVVIGALYFGPLRIADRLGQLLGPAIPRNPDPRPTQLAAGIVASLVNAWVLALFSLNLGGSTLSDGIMLGVLAWLGFMATLTGAIAAFQRRPWNGWVVHRLALGLGGERPQRAASLTPSELLRGI